MRRSIFNNHNLENQLTPDDSEEQDKMEEVITKSMIPSSYVDDFLEEVKDLESHYHYQAQLTIPVVVEQSEQLKPLPPNECETCAVLIDPRLTSCGSCGV